MVIEILREGDLLDVDDDPLITDTRTVDSITFLAPRFGFGIFSTPTSGNEDGRHSAFNDSGQIVFLVDFTDDSQGIFVSNLAVIPEPASLPSSPRPLWHYSPAALEVTKPKPFNVTTGLGSRFGSELLKRGFAGKYTNIGTNKEGSGGLWRQMPYQGLGPEGIAQTFKTLVG